MNKIIQAILTAAGLTFIFWCGYKVSKDVHIWWVENCNDLYGIGNWSVVETTGIEESPKGFIGQSWKCVGLDYGS